LILPCKYENLRELLQGMQEAMKAYSGTVEVMFYRNDIEQEKCLKSLKDNGYTGAVVRPDLSGSGYDMLRKLQEEEYPLVLLENLSPNTKSWCVDAGAFDAAGKAVGFFNKMDRLPIGVVYPPENFGYDFVEGYKKAHRELNIVCHRNCMRCVEKGTTAKNITLALMKIKDPPGSIIYAYPEYLIAAYKALKENTHALKNIKLLSFGTVPNSELFQYPVYSIKRNFLQLGQAAGELLKERIASTDNQRFPGKTKKLTPGVIS
jgi:DNA-binding LacI/PurR family transcriptional regulator